VAIYEFFCAHCIGDFTQRRSIADIAAPAFCPRCGEEARRLFPSGSAIVTRRRTAPQQRTSIPSDGGGKPRVRFKNVGISGFATGIKMNGGVIEGENLTLSGNAVSIDAKNTDVDIKRLKID
jgi:putative FmdB family regulatory protein